MTKPNSMRHLNDALRRIAKATNRNELELRALLANSIVIQMLPPCVVKGGTSLKLRFGYEQTRYTTDLDIAIPDDADSFAEKLSPNLSTGWEGFTGQLIWREKAHPKDVPEEYVMQPFDIKLSYNGKPWCTVALEVGYNEIGDADDAEWVNTPEVDQLLERLGFPFGFKAPLMGLNFQVAQKIHGATDGGSRARDLVDLEIISSRVSIELEKTRAVCVRLFSYRDKQAWPPQVRKGDNWDALYNEAASGLPVSGSVDEAVITINELIRAIDESNLDNPRTRSDMI